MIVYNIIAPKTRSAAVPIIQYQSAVSTANVYTYVHTHTLYYIVVVYRYSQG